MTPSPRGCVERRNGWFETSFMPGRTFGSPADFNTQFADWLVKANARVVRTIKAAPVDLVEADRAAMLPLPPIPLHLGWRNKIRLGRDYYVRLDTNDYSVDPTMIGRMVDVTADLDRVRVRCEGRIVAEHVRVWARGTTVTDPVHVEIAAWLRKQFQQPRAVAAGALVMTWPGTWPTTTAPSDSTTAQRRGRGQLMAATKTTGKASTAESVKQLHYLASALKAPRITEAADRLADQARDAGWSFEDYLAAVLEREVSARNASGARLRIRAAGFGAPKTLEDFDFDAQPADPQPGRRAGLRGVPDRGPQHRAARPAGHRQDPPRHRARDRRSPPRPPGAVRDRDRLGHPPHRRPPRRPPTPRARPAAPLRTDHRRRGRLPALRARRREPVLPARLVPLRTRLARS